MLARALHYTAPMQPLHAVVKNGRLTLDLPSDLPEGHVVALLPLEELLSLTDAYGDDEGVTFELPTHRWARPKTLDAAALIDELRSI